MPAIAATGCWRGSTSSVRRFAGPPAVGELLPVGAHGSVVTIGDDDAQRVLDDTLVWSWDAA